MTPKEAFKGLCDLSRVDDEDFKMWVGLKGEVEQAITELEKLKSWRDELNETIQDLISKAKYWEEKENKTDFEKGIARGYKTMLHQLLVGIDFDKEELK